MTSIQPARAICSCNVEKKKLCVGLGWPTLMWLGPHRLIQGASHGMEEENQSLLLTSFPTSCVCWLVHICSWHTGALLSCALPPSHLSSMEPKSSKIKTTAWDQTCRPEDMQRLPPAAAISKADGKALLQESRGESAGSKDVLCAPRPSGHPWRTTFLSPAYMFRCVSKTSGTGPCWLL